MDAQWADAKAFRAGQLAAREHARLFTSVGIIDLLREGDAPLDFATVSAKAMTSDLGDGPARFRSRASKSPDQRPTRPCPGA